MCPLKTSRSGNIDAKRRFADAFPFWWALFWALLLAGLLAYVLASQGLSASAVAVCVFFGKSTFVIGVAFFTAKRLCLSRSDMMAFAFDESPRAGQLAGLVAVGIGAHIAVWGLISLVQPQAQTVATELSPLLTALHFVSLVIFAPIAEEIAFRFSLQPRLVRMGGRAAGLCMACAVFAVLHGPSSVDVVAAAVLGLVTGLIALSGRGVAYAVALHSGWNISALL